MSSSCSAVASKGRDGGGVDEENCRCCSRQSGDRARRLTQAADLFGTAPPPLGEPASNPQVEIGSNWYIRGDLGYGEVNSPTIVPSAGLIPPVLYDIPGTWTGFDYFPVGNSSTNAPVFRGNNKTKDDGVFDLGLGFRVNNILRLEATYSFWKGPGLGYQQKSLCPNTAAPVSNTVNVTTNGVTAPTSVPVGYLWSPVSCTGILNAKQYNNVGLASAYFYLGNFWGVAPDVGAGAGVNANTISGSTTFTNDNDGSGLPREHVGERRQSPSMGRQHGDRRQRHLPSTRPSPANPTSPSVC